VPPFWSSTCRLHSCLSLFNNLLPRGATSSWPHYRNMCNHDIEKNSVCICLSTSMDGQHPLHARYCFKAGQSQFY